MPFSEAEDQARYQRYRRLDVKRMISLHVRLQLYKKIKLWRLTSNEENLDDLEAEIGILGKELTPGVRWLSRKLCANCTKVPC